MATRTELEDEFDDEETFRHLDDCRMILYPGEPCDCLGEEDG